MITIRDYLKQNRTDSMAELLEILSESKVAGSDQELTREGLLAYAIELSFQAKNLYNAGFDEAIKLIDEADRNFLNRKLPPHIKKL